MGIGFNRDQDPTKGIDNTTVETVDMRDIASDTWKEKTSDDQVQHNEQLFALGVVRQVKKELPQAPSNDTTYSKKKLRNDIQRIRHVLDDIEHQKQYPQKQFGQIQSYQRVIDHQIHPGLIEVIPEAACVLSQPVFTRPHTAHQPPKTDISNKTVGEGRQEHSSTFHTDTKSSQKVASETTTSVPEPSKLKKPTKPKYDPHPNERASKEKMSTNAVQLSRRHSKAINKLMKGDIDELVELALTYNALDFAGQKEYHPMHHCFITRRAIYLVVFNLQKMVGYIREKKQAIENPVEQIRYWLHSIHAHVFPPNEGDHMRRVCLVGTHRCPSVEEEVTEEQLEQINNELKVLEHDGRCVSHLHYTSNPVRMFVAIENSMDKKEQRELSGVLQLQGELKDVSNNLSFLKEDHPVIWLNFEARLVETCNARRLNGRSVVVPEEKVVAIASQQGIEGDNLRLALEFFHDTGKIVCLRELLLLLNLL